jgi:glycosyltransferase involved in cell wall biosynthesis
MDPSSSISIGYFSPGWPQETFSNGVIAYVADMAYQMKRMGHQVTIVAGKVVGETPGIPVYDLSLARQGRRLGQHVLERIAFQIAPRWSIDQFGCRLLVKVVRRAVAEQGIQIFEMEEAFGWAASVRKAISVPLCIRLHGPWFLNGEANGVVEDREFRRRVHREGQAIASADAVSSSSRDVLERTRAYYNLALRDAEVIYPPSCSVLPAEHWRQEECNPNQVLFVGRFDRHKGGDLVIEAFGRVLREVPRAQLIFAGPDRGYTDSDGRSWRLEEFVRDRLPGALESGQVSLLGRTPFSALAVLRRRALVTIVCSRYENAPRVLIEAMSLGCPIVAARVGGIPELLEDGQDGLLHRAEDADDLAARILSLLNNPARAAELGRSAAAACERRFDPEIIARQTMAFYRRLIRDRGKSA